MHRRLQIGRRENPASDRRHGSRLVLQEDLYAAVKAQAAPGQGVVTDSDSVRVQSMTEKGFATGGKRAGAWTVTATIEPSRDAEIRTDASHDADKRSGGSRDDADFEPLLDVAEAARLLRIHPKTLRVKARHGIIPGIQIGRAWRFRASMLNRWLEEISGGDVR